jgi:hypothetical protein
MKTLDDFEALLRLVPYSNKHPKWVTPIGWVSYCKSIGLINEEERENACKYIKQYLFLFK